MDQKKSSEAGLHQGKSPALNIPYYRKIIKVPMRQLKQEFEGFSSQAKVPPSGNEEREA